MRYSAQRCQKAQAISRLVFMLILLITAVSGGEHAFSLEPAGEVTRSLPVSPDLASADSGDLCPPLSPPTGSTITVSTVTELENAVGSASSGDTILVADGTYNLNGVYLRFDVPNVTLRSVSGNRESVILDGNYASDEIIQIVASNVTIADLTLREAYYHPIHVMSSSSADTTGTFIYNIHIVDPGEQAIKINPYTGQNALHFPDDGVIACSHIELTNAGRPHIRNDCYTGGVDAHQARDWVIRDNLIEGFWCDSGLSEHGIHLWRSCRDTLVERNELRNNARGIGFGMATSGDGIRTYPDDPCPGAGGGYVDHYGGIIRNNFVFVNESGLFASDYGFDCGVCLWQACGAEVLHNTVASTQAPFSSIEWRFEHTDVDIINNLVSHNLVDRGGTASLEGNLENQSLSLFVDGANGDLHLTEGADSAIDHGVLLSAGLCDDDFDGDVRPIGAAPDVGADEYGTPPTATPTPSPTSTPTPGTPAPTPTPTRTGGPPTYHFIYLPLLIKHWSAPVPTPTPTPTKVIPAGLIQPGDLVYQGAFRLPGGDTPPQTFAYGGNAMTFNPDGDPANSDAYPGSLFVMGHDRMAYGVLPDGGQVAEISIPAPAVASNPADLPQGAFIQGFHDVAAGYFTQLEEIPRTGMQYLNHPATGPKIHLCWGQHLQFQDEPSHAWFNPTLATPNLQGVWFISNQHLYRVNGYMFDIPAAWADAHAESRYLATGRMRDGGQGGMGPALIAYRPWLPDGSAPPSGTHLEETTLLLYENAYNTTDFVRCMNGYQHADEWEGGAWMTTPSGKSTVLFAGTKSTGAKHWYGFINPLGPEYPCVDEESVPGFLTCRMADGSSCPPEDFAPCCDEVQDTCVTYRGWWSSRWDAQLILYDPADLARVAAGEIESWEPQPYAFLDIDEHLYLDPPVWDLTVLGWGVQRRNRIGAAAYDRNNAVLYVLEQSADGAKPVVHVWRVEG